MSADMSNKVAFVAVEPRDDITVWVCGHRQRVHCISSHNQLAISTGIVNSIYPYMVTIICFQH